MALWSDRRLHAYAVDILLSSRSIPSMESALERATDDHSTLSLRRGSALNRNLRVLCKAKEG